LFNRNFENSKHFLETKETATAWLRIAACKFLFNCNVIDIQLLFYYINVLITLSAGEKNDFVESKNLQILKLHTDLITSYLGTDLKIKFCWTIKIIL